MRQQLTVDDLKDTGEYALVNVSATFKKNGISHKATGIHRWYYNGNGLYYLGMNNWIMSPSVQGLLGGAGNAGRTAMRNLARLFSDLPPVPDMVMFLLVVEVLEFENLLF